MLPYTHPDVVLPSVCTQCLHMGVDIAGLIHWELNSNYLLVQNYLPLNQLWEFHKISVHDITKGILTLVFSTVVKVVVHCWKDIFYEHFSLTKWTTYALTFDDRQSSPLSFLPSGADEPALDFLYEECQILWVWFHDLIKFCKLPRSEEDLRQTKLEIFVVKTQSFEQSLKIEI